MEKKPTEPPLQFLFGIVMLSGIGVYCYGMFLLWKCIGTS